ncbi:cadherin-like protein 26 isoform X1 [Clarias gariepinus]|uniref:cadherin-like protein 26 isoform X1 n=1 Tax=Clarias gariepinus TaxID=13013 RepID=UPI00234D759D|nr:cadherin-like protein 26 isoform X1 [Clarias gariepinus]
MRTLTLIMIIFTITQVGAQEIGSPLNKIRQKRSWVVDIFTIKRGFVGLVGDLTFYVKIVECKIYGPGIDKEPVGLFTIAKEEKKMYVNRNMNYDDRKNFTLIFECANLRHVYERLAVEIQIEEVHEPYFSKGTYVINAEETMMQGTNLLTLHAPNEQVSANLIFNVKVTPNPHSVMFAINEKREISFHGCLDYEENTKYTVVVEAKDQGYGNTRSSTATVIINVIDKNDQKPIITGKRGSGQVKERETGAEVYRIQVSDLDTPGSSSWLAKFTLYGEKAENFNLKTNPDNNEGILYVVKPLDFEETQFLNLTVQVENEEPFFSCSVRTMYYGDKLWEVDYSRNGTSSAKLSFPITVINVNDPPEFTDPVKHVTVMENTPPGRSLWTFTATDHDKNPPNTHRFMKGRDIDNWVTIDSRTGKVSTAKVLDRESQFVTNSTYTVILHAVDDGTPPQTGTGTLIIHLLDENDNAPVLKDNKLTLCLPKHMINITAVDPDLPPFSAPFTYELQGDMGTWRIEPAIGETVSLVKDSMAPGSSELILKIIDSGGLSSLQKLSVTVHNCSRSVSPYLIRAGAAGTSVIFLCFLLMLCILLMMFTCSWGSYMTTQPLNEDTNSFLRRYNEEGPGCDVKVPVLQRPVNPPLGSIPRKNNKNSLQWYSDLNMIRLWENWELNDKYFWQQNVMKIISDESLNHMWTHVKTFIEKKLVSLHEQERELNPDLYESRTTNEKPHPYNDEGKPGELAQLDSITPADTHFSLDENLGPKFQRLAEKCRPDLMQESYEGQFSLSSYHYQHQSHHHHHVRPL